MGRSCRARENAHRAPRLFDAWTKLRIVPDESARLGMDPRSQLQSSHLRLFHHIVRHHHYHITDIMADEDDFKIRGAANTPSPAAPPAEQVSIDVVVASTTDMHSSRRHPSTSRRVVVACETRRFCLRIRDKSLISLSIILTSRDHRLISRMITTRKLTRQT